MALDYAPLPAKDWVQRLLMMPHLLAHVFCRAAFIAMSAFTGRLFAACSTLQMSNIHRQWRHARILMLHCTSTSTLFENKS